MKSVVSQWAGPKLPYHHTTPTPNIVNQRCHREAQTQGVAGGKHGKVEIHFTCRRGRKMVTAILDTLFHIGDNGKDIVLGQGSV